MGETNAQLGDVVHKTQKLKVVSTLKMEKKGKGYEINIYQQRWNTIRET